MPRFPLLMLLVFAVTLFVSASLLFVLEPMVGKMILPLLGGTPAVWNTCMVFFQAILLAGYAYAHASVSALGSRKQALCHLALLILPFFFFPLAVNRQWLVGHEENPVFALLGMLSLCVGVPLFVVCSSAPLLQKWFAGTAHPAARDPYFLYGASNLGSMLALLAYPVLIEPYCPLGQQASGWIIGYGVLAALTALCALLLWRSPSPAKLVSGRVLAAQKAGDATAGDVALPYGTSPERPSGSRRLRWVLLAAVPSSLMLGTTTYITTDIAAIPLLWVVPLAIYLLSFILVFAQLSERVQVAVLALVGVAIAALVWSLVGPVIGVGIGAGFFWWTRKPRGATTLHGAMVRALPLLVLGLVFISQWQAEHIGIGVGSRIFAHLMTLFMVAMVCHGELARDRPGTRYLTSFYLWMSAGGVLGGLFNALAAPLLFDDIYEHGLAIVLACMLLPQFRREPGTPRSSKVGLALMLGMVLLGVLLISLRMADRNLPYEYLARGAWGWRLAALFGGLCVGLAALRRQPGDHLQRAFDLLLPAALAVLVVGLSWGMSSSPVQTWGRQSARWLRVNPYTLSVALRLSLPLILCYTFIQRPLRFGLGLGALLVATELAGWLSWGQGHVFQKRNFFGVLRILDTTETYKGKPLKERILVHGTTLHGKQFCDPNHPELASLPTIHFHYTSPIGQIFGAYNKDPAKPYAVIGLGTGTLACYALAGQHVTYFDIDPAVRDISFRERDPYFTFLAQARARGAHVKLELGDARVRLERLPLADANKYWLLVVDAFSSDAIPIHLITREALQVYRQHMAPGGLICFHISNRYVDLRPVLDNLAGDLKMVALHQTDEDMSYPGKLLSIWVVLAERWSDLSRLDAVQTWSSEGRLRVGKVMACMASLPDPRASSLGLALYGVAREIRPLSIWKRHWAEPGDPHVPDPKKVGVWTDDYSNLFSVFEQ